MLARGFLAFVLVGVVSAARRLGTFDAFVEKYGRTYTRSSVEWSERRHLYELSEAAAREQNTKPSRLWTAGVNKLWDRRGAELKELRGWDRSVQPAAGSSSSRAGFLAYTQNKDLPTDKAWFDLRSSRHIRDQGACGSCWAVAAATVLEGHSEIYKGGNSTVSVQQLISCTPNPRHCGGDGGCKGATAELAMAWVLAHGVVSESDQPYKGAEGSCRLTAEPDLKMAHVFNHKVPSTSAAFGMTGWETLPINKYQPLIHAIAERGPAAVSVSAGPWTLYEQGIFNGCPKDAVVDHVVTAMGYGVENGTKYWLIQNSWSDDWGENGFIRLLRHEGDNDYCGMNPKPELGVGCKGDTAPVAVCGMCGVLFDSVVPHFT